MIAAPANARIWIAAGVTDLRRGFSGLSALAQTALEQDPERGRFIWPQAENGIVSAELQNTCCQEMARRLDWKCDVHQDIWDCPDALVFRSKNNPNTYGLIIHDGGSSFLRITFCPWCGSKLAGSNEGGEP